MTEHRAAYTARATREGRFWHIEIAGVGATQARQLRDVDEMARDYIASMYDVEPNAVEVDVTMELPASVRSHLKRADELRRRSAAAQKSAAGEARAAAQELAAQGLTMREIGQLLGLSHQRVHQLLSQKEQPAGA